MLLLFVKQRNDRKLTFKIYRLSVTRPRGFLYPYFSSSSEAFSKFGIDASTEFEVETRSDVMVACNIKSLNFNELRDLFCAHEGHITLLTKENIKV